MFVWHMEIPCHICKICGDICNKVKQCPKTLSFIDITGLQAKCFWNESGEIFLGLGRRERKSESEVLTGFSCQDILWGQNRKLLLNKAKKTAFHQKVQCDYKQPVIAKTCLCLPTHTF